MTTPPSRGCVNTHSISVPIIPNSGIPRDDCPHCLNGGGKAKVEESAGHDWRVYEPLNKNVPFREDAGLCGDAIEDSAPRAHEAGGTFGPSSNLPFVASYVQGQIIEFVVDVTTNHNGFFEFFICDVTQCDGGDITEDCFKDGHCHQLLRVSTPECESQNSKECGPIDTNFPGRWYVPCRQTGEHFQGGKFMKYELPAGFVSNQAVIQWYWATANSCNPPGFAEYFENHPMPGWGSCDGDGGATGGINTGLSTCGGTKFPEEFWTCSDVFVSASGAPISINPNSNVDDDDVDEEDDDDSNNTQQQQKNQHQKKKQKKQQKQQQNKDDEDDDDDDDKKIGTMKNKKCAQNWHPCGGMYHDGGTSCCNDKYECIYESKYYSQCKEKERN